MEFPQWLANLTLGQVIGILSAASASVLMIWKGWPAFRRAVRWLSRFVKLIDALSTLPEDLEVIKHELQANSGKSVKDIAQRTEANTRELAAGQEYQKRQIAALKTSLQKTNRRLEEHINPKPKEASS